MEKQVQRMYCKHCGWAADEESAGCDERLQVLRYLPSEKKQAEEFLERLKGKE